MRTPLSWLKDFAPFPDDAGLLRATLDDLGLVVEEIEVVGEGLSDVVIARIDEITAIEGADRVRRVVVEAGGGPLEIVCGATNFELGDLVPLAPVGAVLPGGFEIAKRKMRGVTSNGMLCSGRELGLGDDHAGLLILTHTAAAPGERLIDVLRLEPDVIFDVTVEGNRPDAWCISGIARDLAARLNLPFSFPSLSSMPLRGSETAERASLEVVDTQLSPRFSVAVVDGVEVGDSPSWVVERLEKAGMRSINNVVDASNYVMLELGQPNHPDDLAKVQGPGLRVRRAAPGESLTTLDGVERSLGVAGRSVGDTGTDVVICDAANEILGIAGILGGATSEIDASTTTILFEAATFDPITVTRTSRRLALRTEAAARFSKGTDPAVLEAAIDRFGQILALSAPSATMAPSPLFVPEAPPTPLEVVAPIDRINAILGTSFEVSEVAGLLGRIGFECAVDGDKLTVTVPTNRPDIRAGEPGVADLAEEVARTWGYSRLPRRTPTWPQPGRPGARQAERARLRRVLCGLGATEAWTSSLVAPDQARSVGFDEEEIVVANPLTEGESRLRRSLLPGLLDAAGRNLDRRADDVALFEIGATFVHPSSLPGRASRAGARGSGEVTMPAESERLSLVLARDGDDATSALAAFSAIADALRLSRVIVATQDEATSPALAGLHPSRSGVLVDKQTGAVVGVVGEIDPEVVTHVAPGARDRRLGWLDLDLDVLWDPGAVLRRPLEAAPISRYPSADLDLAFVVPDPISVESLLDAISEGAGDLLESVRLFDVYRGAGVDDGARSLAVRCRLVALDRTLDDAQLAEVRARMVGSAEALGCRLR